jgi:hypothetical protein
MWLNPAGLNPEKMGKPWSIRRMTTRRWLIPGGPKQMPFHKGWHRLLGEWLST